MENISPETQKLIRDSLEIFTANKDTITIRMYDILFERYPETQKLFKTFRSKQPNMFLAAIMAHTLSLKDPEVLLSYRIGIARSHVIAGVQEHHYPMLIDALMCAMKETLKNQLSLNTYDAWEKWFYFLANLLIERERDHYSGKHLLAPAS